MEFYFVLNDILTANCTSTIIVYNIDIDKHNYESYYTRTNWPNWQLLFLSYTQLKSMSQVCWRTATVNAVCLAKS
jgi:hypothetical protein